MHDARRWTRYAASTLAAVATFAVAGPIGAATASPVAAGYQPARAVAGQSSQQAFIARIAPAAQQTQRSSGIPASVIIAQAILESGWGQTSLTRNNNNYFGIKCWGGAGLGSGCVDYATKEHRQGKAIASLETFRSYPNAAASFADYARFLRGNSRYRNAFRYTGQPDQFVREVARAGYATDPAYAAKVIRLMKTYNLYRYDR
jgi:flagellum-specific peptidoglycan hydrolase FlgJ